jgi:hypothetical protein
VENEEKLPNYYLDITYWTTYGVYRFFTYSSIDGEAMLRALDKLNLTITTFIHIKAGKYFNPYRIAVELE